MESSSSIEDYDKNIEDKEFVEPKTKRGRPKKVVNDNSEIKSMLTTLLKEIKMTNERIDNIEFKNENLNEREKEKEKEKDKESKNSLVSQSNAENLNITLQNLLTLQLHNQISTTIKHLTGEESYPETLAYFKKFENITTTLTYDEKISLLVSKLKNKSLRIFESLSEEDQNNLSIIKKTIMNCATGEGQRLINQNSLLNGIKRNPNEDFIEFSFRVLKITRNSLLTHTHTRINDRRPCNYTNY